MKMSGIIQIAKSKYDKLNETILYTFGEVFIFIKKYISWIK